MALIFESYIKAHSYQGHNNNNDKDIFLNHSKCKRIAESTPQL